MSKGENKQKKKDPRQWWEKMVYFFPLQLLFVHLKKSQQLLVFWIFLFLVLFQMIGEKYGIPYLFLAPEYLGDLSIWSYAIFGFALGGFVMAFNIASYIMELKKIDNTNIYEFEISGKITEEELDNLYLAFTQFKENNEKVNLLGKIDQIPSFDVFQNLSKIVKMKLASLKVIHKYAILTDRELIENLAPIGNFFSPSIQVKTFESDEREDAINWLNEKNVNEYDPDEYLTGIDIKKIDASTYEIDIAGSEIDHEIPIITSNNLIIVPLEINGKEYNFLFDTGAPTSISFEIQEEFDFKKVSQGTIRDTDRNKRKVNYVRVDQMRMGGLDFEIFTAFVADFDANAVLACLDIDGIVGSNMMYKYNWLIDRKEKKMLVTNNALTYNKDEDFIIPFKADQQYNMTGFGSSKAVSSNPFAS